MTDFVKTMHDWSRMCEAQRTAKNLPIEDVDYCQFCPLSGTDCYESFDLPTNKLERIEKVVKEWVAENPEYPTWIDWLMDVGAISKDMWSVSELQKHIPKEIAEKIGVVPKES